MRALYILESDKSTWAPNFITGLFYNFTLYTKKLVLHKLVQIRISWPLLRLGQIQPCKRRERLRRRPVQSVNNDHGNYALGPNQTTNATWQRYSTTGLNDKAYVLSLSHVFLGEKCTAFKLTKSYLITWEMKMEDTTETYFYILYMVWELAFSFKVKGLVDKWLNI